MARWKYVIKSGWYCRKQYEEIKGIVPHELYAIAGDLVYIKIVTGNGILRG